jgi:Flp pilus assembly protein TadG
MKKLFDISAKLKSQKGVTAVYVAILLVVFIGMAAFAIDVGYTRVVRNQLQNAADAAALAACNRFYARGPVIVGADPNWGDAVAEAASAITVNTAANNPLQVGVTVTGWWDITQAYPGNMWPNPLTNPPPNTPPTANYGPAVRVTITKTAGQNNGPIMSLFGGIFGVQTTDSGATATAVAASPGSARAETLAPVAMAKQVVDTYYTQYRCTASSTLPYDPAKTITIGSPYQYPNSLAGQWTSFQLDTNNVPDVQGLISNGNATMLSTGDNIWIEPGVKDALYDQKNQPSIEKNYAGDDIFFPIVDAIISDITHSSVPIAGFIGFHVICAGKGCDGTPYDPNPAKNNEFIIVGCFVTPPAYGGPVGPHYGPLDRCRLCQ